MQVVSCTKATYIIVYFFYRCIRVFPYQSIIRSTIFPRMSRIVVQVVQLVWVLF